ncbi:siderophore-interacting protein [Microbacterium aquilitoris]|uniref:siderophore-interacting protein n=1 Tax=Microbacterium aquilitoris TaxID=3067307 RepID=UPI00288EA704|nr:siderophore-interacting protein [Microbacterium sp. KSW2-22]MDT3345967.1 siderophore-interacting protein [Microbacterium sp. KSW2-22]
MTAVLERPWAYSAFEVEVAATVRLSMRFIRITLRGDALRNFAEWGLDQRIKLVLPLPGGGLADFGLLDEPTPHPSDWYTRWKELDETERNVLRTYTPAAIRADDGEIDVDVYLHTPAGPASAWAASARPGDRLVVTGPDRRMGWTGYGLHWHPGSARRVLLVADETAYPAARNIVSALPDGVVADVMVDAAAPADDLLSPHVVSPHRAHRIDREDAGGLERAVAAWADATADLPRDEVYVWLAGESGTVTSLRRLLTGRFGVPKDRVSFLGYWREGGPLVG